jgi:hypothetical protein
MRRLSLAIIISLIFIQLSIAYPMPGNKPKNKKLPNNKSLPPINDLKDWRITKDVKLEVGSTAQVVWDYESRVGVFIFIIFA